MRIEDKYAGFSAYRDLSSRDKKLQKSPAKSLKLAELGAIDTKEIGSLVDLNSSAVYFSRSQMEEKINGVEEANKLLVQMNRYLSQPSISTTAVEFANQMDFNTNRIVSLFL